MSNIIFDRSKRKINILLKTIILVLSMTTVMLYIMVSSSSVARAAFTCHSGLKVAKENGADCCKMIDSSEWKHTAWVKLTITDSNTGDRLPNASVHMYFNGGNTNNLCDSELSGVQKNFYGTTDSNGQVVFDPVNCWIRFDVHVTHNNYYDGYIYNIKPDNGNGTSDGTSLDPMLWTITPNSKVVPNVQTPGSQVTFTHWLHQNGAGDTTKDIDGAIRWTRRLDDTTVVNRGSYTVNNGWNAGTNKYPLSSNINPHTFTIPGTKADYWLDGKQYCQDISANPLGTEVGFRHGGSSDNACVTIHIPHWGITPSSGITATSATGTPHNQPAGVNTIWVNKGDKVYFKHSVINDPTKGGESTERVVSGKTQWTSPSGSLISNYSHGVGWTSGTTYSHDSAVYTVPNNAQLNTPYCQNIIATPQAWNNLTEIDSTPVCFMVTEPTPATYQPISTGSDYEKGGTVPTFTMGVTVTNPQNRALACNSPTGEIITWTNRGTIPAIDGTNTISGSYALINCGGLVTSTVTKSMVDIGIAGSDAAVKAKLDAVSTFPYTITRTTSLSLSPLTMPGYTHVYEVPYARFYGGDVYAMSGDIYFNKNNLIAGGLGGGAAAQYAAIAATAATSNYINTNVFMGLSPTLNAKWAYTPGDSTSPYKDVKAKLPDQVAANDLTAHYANTFDIRGNSFAEGYYYSTSGTLTTAWHGLSHDKKYTLSSMGDIYISDDIKVNSAQIPTVASGLSHASVILLLASGNIYIAPSVQQIDAILIAQGTIYTCATNTGSIPTADLDSVCNTKLTINGAIGASHISFLRSKGSRLLGSPNENNPYTGGLVTGTAGNNTEAAEVINFPTYLYFANPLLNDDSKSGFQSIYNAAPLF